MPDVNSANSPCYFQSTSTLGKSLRKRRISLTVHPNFREATPPHYHIKSFQSPITRYSCISFGHVFELCRTSTPLQKPTNSFQGYTVYVLFLFSLSIMAQGRKEKKASSKSFSQNTIRENHSTTSPLRFRVRVRQHYQSFISTNNQKPIDLFSVSNSKNMYPPPIILTPT